jgi:hypothetical protein
MKFPFIIMCAFDLELGGLTDSRHAFSSSEKGKMLIQVFRLKPDARSNKSPL